MKQLVTIPKNIEYVAVEIIDKKGTPEDCKIITGLFKGLATLENNNTKQLFILMTGPDNAVDIYSFKYYDIMTLIACGKETKAMTYFTLSTDDQKHALEALKNIVIKMYAENRMLEHDPDVIDISTFKNIPDNIKRLQKVFCKVSNNTTQHNEITTSYVKKDPEPSTIKRIKTKKPTERVLFEMITKIANIKKGTLTITLPELLGDENVDKNYTTPSYFRT